MNTEQHKSTEILMTLLQWTGQLLVIDASLLASVNRQENKSQRVNFSNIIGICDISFYELFIIKFKKKSNNVKQTFLCGFASYFNPSRIQKQSNKKFIGFHSYKQIKNISTNCKQKKNRLLLFRIL